MGIKSEELLPFWPHENWGALQQNSGRSGPPRTTPLIFCSGPNFWTVRMWRKHSAGVGMLAIQARVNS